MTYILETEKLRLRQFTLDDTDFIIELLNSSGWLEYIGDRNVKTPEQAKAYLEHGPLKSYADHGYGLSLVEKKDGNQPIGMCGLLKRDYLDDPDIGFAFLPDAYGKGYAFEVAQATMAYAKEQLQLTKIAAITVPHNVKSIRLLEKLGLHLQKPINLPDGKEVMLYSN